MKYTRNVYYIGNLEFARLVPGEAHFYNLDGDEIEKQTTEIKWDAEAAEKGGFEHFMMKEIHEQPKAVQDTFDSVIKNGTIDLSSVEITEDEIKNFEQIYIVACGSAWHVGMAAQYVLEDMADIPVRVELASEFRYRKMPVNQKALVIVVSQSGETADTLAALRLAKEKGITTLAVVNVVGSSIAREADKVFYTLAGPEISVATTKAYSAQLAATYCLAVQFAKIREKITEEQYSYYISEMLTIPEKMQKILEDKERIQWFAAKYANAHDVFFVGRGIDYPFEMKVQGIDRTLADKVFAVCDYYLQGKVAKHSRHLYDIYKLLPLVPQDENFKELVKEVRAVREQSVICPSALPEANVPELLEKIIKEKAYKQDYDSLTTQLLEENVPYDTVIATLKKVAESSIFENN